MTELALGDFIRAFLGRVRDVRTEAVSDEVDVGIEPWEIAFTEVFLADLEELGQVPGCDHAYLEKRIGRANARLNAFAVADDETQLDLIVAVSRQAAADDALPRVSPGDVGAAARAAMHAYRSAARPYFKEMEPSSPAYDMARRLHEVHDRIRLVRIVVLVEGHVSRIPDFDESAGSPEIQVDVWDLERLFRASSSSLAYESLVLDFEEVLGEPLACLPSLRVADDYVCYLAVLPGDFLHDLYHQHGPRLLELNVRSFLQARGKVNRGIRDTLMGDPEHFMPFNNGISATVEDAEVVVREDGTPGIKSVRGLQIVNGGQTVASIHRAKNRDKADLSSVFVQAKITQVTPEALDALVPSISRFSNTQNRVNETDFSANHPFHVRIQQLSESTWAPGEVSRWFYERARGQWEVARIREGTTPKRRREFDERTPRKQKLDKALLAKVENAWREKPHVVSMGGQKNFVQFMASLSDFGATWLPDSEWYRTLIGRVIAFKEAERIARRLKFTGYRANAVCYTISMLAYRTVGRINFDRIWEDQSVSEALSEVLESWMPRVHGEIVETAGERNVTEWCKKKECWAVIQSLPLVVPSSLEQELSAGQPLPNVGGSRKSGKKAPALSAEDRERQARVMKLDATDWQRVIKWMVSTGRYQGFPVDVAGTILGYAAGGWARVPSPKQTKYLVQYIADFEAENASLEGEG